ncbi:MAG: YggT family protein [Azoarcus sp.]|jgi:YggT family protein|nr:YggT family protein [Azoarcus sp.]
MLVDILRLIINTVFGLIALTLLARFFMQWARVSFRNPGGQFVLATTDWVVRPLRRFIPGLFGLDLATLLAAWVAQMLNLGLVLVLLGAPASSLLAAVPLYALLKLAQLAVYLIMGIVIVAVVLSWVAPHAPAAAVVNGLMRPFITPFRRIIPPLGGVDFSPLVLLLVLQVILMALSRVSL